VVDGYLGKLTTEHRMLIHLFDNKLPNSQWEAPAALTQAGISAAVHVQRKHVPRTLKRLEKAGEISINSRHVPGAKQRRKVYSLTTTGRTRASLLVEQTLGTSVIYEGETVSIRDIPRGERKILEVLSHIDEEYYYHKDPIISSIAEPSGKASLDAQSSEELVKRMFARAWEDGIITYDEHQLISEVVEFLGMHPSRIKRLSEQARESIIVSPPEDIYLEMLSQALVDNQLVEDEVALLETYRGAYGITDETHEKLLNLAIQEPVYPDNVKTYLNTLETALFDGVITADEDAMLATLRKSLGISDIQHANFTAKIRDSIK
jgi:DNA-binding MarR family transcriptional regulator